MKKHLSSAGDAAGVAASVSALVAGLALVLAVAPRVSGAVVFGQLDDFETGTTMGWREGGESPNPPTNVSTGGPDGAGDAYLRNLSSGDREGSRMVMFNEAQWAGDFNAAHVTRVDGWAANFGTTPLNLRVAVRSGAGTAFGSRTAVVLPAGSGWRRVSFDLTAAGLARIGGSQSLPSVLSTVRTFRVVSAASGPAWEGDDMNATLGVDDLRALHLPGDANFDNRVNAADLLTWRRNLADRGAGVDWTDGDFNFDDRVDARDLVLLRRNFGRSVSVAGVEAAAVVPEPGVGPVLLTGSLTVLGRRRRL